MPSTINVNFQSLDDRWTIGWLRRPSSIHIGAGKKRNKKFVGPNWTEGKKILTELLPSPESPFLLVNGQNKWEMILFLHLNVVHMIMLRKNIEVISSAGYFLVSILCWWPFCAIYFTAWSNAEKYLGVKMLAGYSKCWSVIVTNFTGNHWPIKHFWDQEEAKVKK